MLRTPVTEGQVAVVPASCAELPGQEARGARAAAVGGGFAPGGLVVPARGRRVLLRRGRRVRVGVARVVAVAVEADAAGDADAAAAGVHLGAAGTFVCGRREAARRSGARGEARQRAAKHTVQQNSMHITSRFAKWMRITGRFGTDQHRRERWCERRHPTFMTSTCHVKTGNPQLRTE